MPQGKFESGETKIVNENKPVTKRDSSKVHALAHHLHARQEAVTDRLAQEESQDLDSIQEAAIKKEESKPHIVDGDADQ